MKLGLEHRTEGIAGITFQLSPLLASKLSLMWDRVMLDVLYNFPGILQFDILEIWKSHYN